MSQQETINLSYSRFLQQVEQGNVTSVTINSDDSVTGTFKTPVSQLAVALRAQGLDEEAVRFAYRTQLLQRIVIRRQSKFGQYLFSLLLDLLAGYGYRPGRSVIAYQEVLAIGNPLGITQTVTNGIVSALGRTVSEGQGGAVIPNAVQTDAPINPGNSGGALVDLQGNLVGIPTLSAVDPEFNTPANGVGFAIPSDRVGFIVPQIIQITATHTDDLVLPDLPVIPPTGTKISMPYRHMEYLVTGETISALTADFSPNALEEILAQMGMVLPS